MLSGRGGQRGLVPRRGFRDPGAPCHVSFARQPHTLVLRSRPCRREGAGGSLSDSPAGNCDEAAPRAAPPAEPGRPLRHLYPTPAALPSALILLWKNTLKPGAVGAPAESSPEDRAPKPVLFPGPRTLLCGEATWRLDGWEQKLLQWGESRRGLGNPRGSLPGSDYNFRARNPLFHRGPGPLFLNCALPCPGLPPLSPNSPPGRGAVIPPGSRS